MIANNSTLGSRLMVNSTVSNFRRDLGESDPQTFMGVYLSHYLKRESSRMHNELFDLLGKAVTDRRSRIAVAAPRGHAKSTIVSLAYVLWCACYQKEQFMVLISSTSDMAQNLLKHVKDELDHNVSLRSDFPELYPGPRDKWSNKDIILGNGTRIKVFGARQSLRGARQGASRPSLVILDDLENDITTQSADQREKLREWFYSAVLNFGAPETNFIMVGTILHYESLLSTLIDQDKNPLWTGRKYQAVESWATDGLLWDQWGSILNGRTLYEETSGPKAADKFFEANREKMLEGTKVLWEAQEPYVDLMKMRHGDRRASFDAEKQNDPVSSVDVIFKENEMIFWDEEGVSEESLLRSLGGNPRIYGACDPSLGRRGGNHSATAIISVARCPKTKVFYVIDALIAQYTPDQTIQAILDLHL